MSDPSVSAAVDPLVVGTPAPDFALRDHHGQTVTRSGLLGAPTLLVFYPYAFSRVCGGELHALNDTIGQYVRANVMAVSVDSIFALRAYAETIDVTFALLSDFWPHGAVSQAFGVFDEQRGVSHRSTFLLDSEGVIRWSVHSPDHLARDPKAYVAALRQL